MSCHPGHRAHSWIPLCGIAALVLGSLPAAPQTGLTFTNSPFAQFTDEDNKLFLEAVRKAAGGAPGGAPVDWANAGSGAKGTVRYTRKLTGRPEGDCREMQGDNTARGRTEPFRVTVCKDPKGQWRLATNSPKAQATAAPARTGFPQILPASFAGVLPCADCPGMEYRIDFRDDGSYRMRTTYQERGPDRSGLNVDDAGAWQLVLDNTRVTLRSDANSTMTFAIRDPDTLRLLDKSGHEIKGKLNYDLKRSATYTPLGASP